MKYYIIFLSFSLFLTTGYSQNHEFNAGIVYGPKAAFKIAAPDGWILNNEVGKSQGLPCVLYLESSSWKDSPVIMYAKISGYSDKDEFISYAIKTMKSESDKFKFEIVSDTALHNNYATSVYDYSGGLYGNYERVAYIQMKDAVGYIVFSARDKSFFDRYKYDLNKTIESFTITPEYINANKSEDKSPTRSEEPMKATEEENEISWNRTPIEVIKDPQKNERFLWFGVIKDFDFRKISEDTTELIWSCKYLKMKDPSMDYFETRSIRYFDTDNSGNFTVTLRSEMPLSDARKIENRFLPDFSYILAKGIFDRILEVNGKKYVHLITEKMIMVQEPSVGKVK